MDMLQKILSFVKEHKGATFTVEYDILDNFDTYAVKIRDYGLNKVYEYRFFAREHEEYAITYALECAKKELYGHKEKDATVDVPRR